MATNRMFCATGLYGGTSGDLDTIDGADLADNDMAIVIDSGTGIVYFYKMNISGGSATSSPNVITPVSNSDSNNKNWELQEIFTVSTHVSPTPVSDLTATGEKSTVTVDANATGVGALLYMADDGHFEEADADDASTMPAIAVALETGTGTKKVLTKGFIRKDAWNWTSLGQPVYVSTTTGAFTQDAPDGSGDQVQIVGVAWSADIIRFDPDLTVIEIA